MDAWLVLQEKNAVHNCIPKRSIKFLAFQKEIPCPGGCVGAEWSGGCVGIGGGHCIVDGAGLAATTGGETPEGSIIGLVQHTPKVWNTSGCREYMHRINFYTNSTKTCIEVILMMDVLVALGR